MMDILEEDMENYVEYKLSKVSARLQPNVVPHLFACQPDKSSSKKRVRESSEKRSRKKLIVDLMKQSEQKMETEITEESIPEETSQRTKSFVNIWNCTTARSDMSNEKVSF
ncbi:hypothetical protein NQ314_018964 [Rhamnusium bicolor]|uniref:Uncharacterized protein n=1 Tax=Rhamnusium bicolor TaxID=1586634 RepID=A0AAV8WQB0_9CUCU|nr:hypothetical protein NQ314_018964 [Rhamnusium bicolor]